MTLTALQIFNDATAFEQLVLSRLCPLVDTDPGAEIDLRGLLNGNDGVLVNLQITTSLSEQDLAQQRLTLMPLLFGAAWKVLDLALELSLNLTFPQAQRTKEWRINEKLDQARLSAGQHTMLTNDSVVWRAVCAVYIATVEHRHCLIHRTADFGGVPLQLTGRNKNGMALRPITQVELQAFIAVAQLLAQGIDKHGLDSRAANHLRYELDQLQAHTAQATLGGVKSSRPVVIKMVLQPLADGSFEADFALAHHHATRAMHGRMLDLLIEVPGLPFRPLYARLEKVPKQKIVMHLDELPGYLTWQ